MSGQATQDRANSTLAWRLIGVLSLLGLAIATYLMINYARNQTPYCAGSDGCGIVQASEYVTIITGLLIDHHLAVTLFLLQTAQADAHTG